MKMTDDELTAKAYDLIGSCESFGTDDLTIEQCHILDEITMCCEQCGWWVCSDEINDSGECDDCTQDEKS